MRLHFLIKSVYYTQRICDKLASFDSNGQLFVIIDANRKVFVQSPIEKFHCSLPQLNKWLQKQDIDFIYAHFLSNSIAYVIHKTGLFNKPLAWIMWGADFYGLPQWSEHYYLVDSKPFAWKNKGLKSKFSKFLGLPSSDSVLKLIPHINYYIGYKEEYTLVSNAFASKMTYVPLEYYFSLEEFGRPEINQGKGDILLGNSDDPMNNHIDVLKKIEMQIGETHKVICPVSGAKSAYRDELQTLVENLACNVELIHEYLETAAFFKKLDSVGFVIYGHLRQQGVGTLLPLIYSGKKVFLWEANPFYQTLKRWGILVYPLDSFTNSDLAPLNSKEVECQRSALEMICSQEANDARWKNILKLGS